MRSRWISVTVAVIGGLFVVLGIWAGVDSGSFSRRLADFGPEYDHLVHDFGAASVAIGAGLLLAVRRTTWRTPVLVVAMMWNGLHAISHVADIADARSLTIGIAQAAALIAGTVLLGGLALATREEPRTIGH